MQQKECNNNNKRCMKEITTGGTCGGVGNMKYRGIWRWLWGRYATEIKNPHLKVRHWLGTFDTAEEATYAYDCATRAMRGLKAHTKILCPLSSPPHHHHSLLFSSPFHFPQPSPPSIMDLNLHQYVAFSDWLFFDIFGNSSHYLSSSINQTNMPTSDFMDFFPLEPAHLGLLEEIVKGLTQYQDSSGLFAKVGKIEDIENQDYLSLYLDLGFVSQSQNLSLSYYTSHNEQLPMKYLVMSEEMMQELI
ncbi:hypothetical protein NE237_016120 [Protea cynaroides]|uniref:AP2/ERF domain-containing protein n=1 Tax=Protea cynaroides TaxID=273540 RepID=A0A9Q0QRV3_9MAGN|nr:hypothetical protein NE237_016120 [Protea cynaroides]